ncbi:hypothetical protein PV11_09122 [Exophiala sideris]|uniref:Transmembrane protein n=1 Tax=Exophiala sideris TaxID=1016849 RepID=A0A0D1WQE2_9EURO|nr:hypothetical protein PV11_09122 [Exophiala sideris]
MTEPWNYGQPQPPFTSPPALGGPFLSSILSDASAFGFFTSTLEPSTPTIQVPSTMTGSTDSTSSTSIVTNGDNSTSTSSYPPSSGFVTWISTSVLTVGSPSTIIVGPPSTITVGSPPTITVGSASTITFSATSTLTFSTMTQPSWARPPHPATGKPSLAPSNPDEATTSAMGSTVIYVILGILLVFGVACAFITSPSVVRQVKKCLTKRES